MTHQILTPVTMWNDFNTSLPLKSCAVKTYALNKVDFSHVYFSGREVDGERVRIFGVYAKQKTKKANTIIIIPNVNEGISEDMVIHFTGLGYNVLTFDLRGKVDGASDYTKYPQKISYANYDLVGETFYSAHSSAKETCWYEWCAVAKYAVSFALDKNPNGKIGVLGVKYGADVAWMLSGSDDRISAVSFAFGAGWHAYQGISKYSEDDLELNDERYRFISGVDSQSYAQNVKVPVMFVSTTNSAEFDGDRAFDTLQRVDNNDKCWRAFITNAIDVLDDKCLTNIELFFEKFIKGGKIKLYSEPTIEAEIENEEVIYTVEVNKIEDVDRMYLFASSNDIDPIKRVWTVIYPKEKVKNRVIFTRKIYGKLNFDLAFATVVYKNGLTVTSSYSVTRQEVIASTQIPNLLYSTYDIHSCFFVKNKGLNLLGNTFAKDKFIAFVNGPHDILGVSTKNNIHTYEVKNHLDRLTDKSFIQLDAFTLAPDKLSITFTFENGAKFVKKVNLASKNEWQRITVGVNEFKNEIGMPLKRFEGLISLSLSSNGITAINNILIL